MDQNLTFNVAQLLKESIGATRTAEVIAELHHLVPELAAELGADDTEPAELSGPVRLMRTGGDVLVQGHFEAQLVLPCVRCLTPVRVPLHVELEEVFSPTLDVITGQAIVPTEDDRALWIDEHHILDLHEVLRQNVLLAVPLRPLCRPDCRGLCPTCGQNLNDGPCSCRPEPDPRWARLTALLKAED